MEKRIENPTDLEDTFRKINEIYSLFSRNISVDTIQRVIEHTNPEVINNLDKDSKEYELVNNNLKFEEVLVKLSTRGKIKY